MDVMDHHQRVVPRLMKSQRKTNTKSNKKKSSSSKNSSLKVVYISSPMKVQTSPSRFMSLVQELTGKNSDIAHYMEAANNDGDVLRDFYDDRALIKETTSDEHQGVFSSISSEDTPTSSDSFLGPIDDVFISQIDEQFGGIFSSNSLSQCEMDVLGSYDELL